MTVLIIWESFRTSILLMNTLEDALKYFFIGQTDERQRESSPPVVQLKSTNRLLGLKTRLNRASHNFEQQSYLNDGRNRINQSLLCAKASLTL